MYQQRLLLYVDILGWSAAVSNNGEDPRLLKAVELIHAHAAARNERVRQDYIARAEEEGIELSPMYLEVQFGAFSDHFVYSLPVEFGLRIVTTASKLVVDLLRLGWLTRGAIVLGPLHHIDNVIFGPALLEAVEMEERQAVYPRILVSNAALRAFSDCQSDPREKSMIKDQFGRVVVNPFALGFEATGPHAQEILESFVTQNFHFSEIKALLAAEVEKHTSADRGPQAEKWAYLQKFIAGPLLREEPKLSQFW